jgi:hypothetical protein
VTTAQTQAGSAQYALQIQMNMADQFAEAEKIGIGGFFVQFNEVQHGVFTRQDGTSFPWAHVGVTSNTYNVFVAVERVRLDNQYGPGHVEFRAYKPGEYDSLGGHVTVYGPELDWSRTVEYQVKPCEVSHSSGGRTVEDAQAMILLLNLACTLAHAWTEATRPALEREAREQAARDAERAAQMDRERRAAEANIDRIVTNLNADYFGSKVRITKNEKRFVGMNPRRSRDTLLLDINGHSQAFRLPFKVEVSTTGGRYRVPQNLAVG